MKIQALLLLALLPTALRAQTPRTATSPDPTSATDSGDPALASRDDLSALVFVDGAILNGTEVYVTTSDGRGIDWSTPVRVDGDASGAGKKTQATCIDVYGTHVFVTWQDLRNGNQEIYFNASSDGGLTWHGEKVIDKGGGYGVGVSDAFDWRMA